MERLSRLTVFPHPLHSTLIAVTCPAQLSLSINAFLSVSSIMFRFPHRLLVSLPEERAELRVLGISSRRVIDRFFLRVGIGATPPLDSLAKFSISYRFIDNIPALLPILVYIAIGRCSLFNLKT